MVLRYFTVIQAEPNTVGTVQFTSARQTPRAYEEVRPMN